MWEPRRLTTLWAFTAGYEICFMFLYVVSVSASLWNVRVVVNKVELALYKFLLPRMFVARLSKPLISDVAVWKQLHLNQWFAKTRHRCSWSLRSTEATERSPKDARADDRLYFPQIFHTHPHVNSQSQSANSAPIHG
jgi:hypothetical protein